MASKTLSEMLKLTSANNDYKNMFPDELLIAIFWEETLFQNIEQVKGAEGQVGLGFGQVQEDSLPLIKTRMAKSFTRTMIKISDDASVQVAANALEALRRGFSSGSPEVAYKVGYGGGTAAGRLQLLGKFDNRTRGDIVDSVWQASLDLIECGDWDDKEKVKAALMKARPASNDLFDALLI